MNKETGGELAEQKPTSTHKKSKFGKSDSRHWLDKLEQVAWTEDGERKTSGLLMVRMSHQGRRTGFNLDTSNKAAAAKKCVEIWTHLRANGWEPTLAKFKRKEPEKAPGIATVGEFLQAVEATAGLRNKTFADYARALRLIAAAVAGVNNEKGKFGPNGATRTAWLAKINAVSLSELTLERIQRWKIEFIAQARANPAEQLSRKRSANSLVRQAKSLFSKKRRKFISLNLPSPFPFEGIDAEPEGSHRYVSRFDIRKIIREAKKELAKKHLEQFKIFLLAVCAGLRRNEIDKLEWGNVNLKDNSILVTPTEYFTPKCSSSSGEITVEDEVIKILKQYRQKATGTFVVESQKPARTDSTYTHYRCEDHFNALIAWLRSKGVIDRKPLHALRKEFGSIINEKHGIHAASQALRHADIAITAKHYLDNRKRVTPGLGSLLL